MCSVRHVLKRHTYSASMTPFQPIHPVTLYSGQIRSWTQGALVRSCRNVAGPRFHLKHVHLLHLWEVGALGGGAEGDSQASKALVRDTPPLPHIRQVSAYSPMYRFSSGPSPQSTLYRSLDPTLSFPSIHFANCSLPSFIRSFFGITLP